MVCLVTVPAFSSITFLYVFPGFIAKPFRGVGVGLEEPHLRLRACLNLFQPGWNGWNGTRLLVVVRSIPSRLRPF